MQVYLQQEVYNRQICNVEAGVLEVVLLAMKCWQVEMGLVDGG